MHVCKIGFVEWRHLEQLSITLIEDSTLTIYDTQTHLYLRKIFSTSIFNAQRHEPLQVSTPYQLN